MVLVCVAVCEAVCGAVCDRVRVCGGYIGGDNIV